MYLKRGLEGGHEEVAEEEERDLDGSQRRTSKEAQLLRCGHQKSENKMPSSSVYRLSSGNLTNISRPEILMF